MTSVAKQGMLPATTRFLYQNVAFQTLKVSSDGPYLSSLEMHRVIIVMISILVVTIIVNNNLWKCDDQGQYQKGTLSVSGTAIPRAFLLILRLTEKCGLDGAKRHGKEQVQASNSGFPGYISSEIVRP